MIVFRVGIFIVYQSWLQFAYLADRPPAEENPHRMYKAIPAGTTGNIFFGVVSPDCKVSQDC